MLIEGKSFIGSSLPVIQRDGYRIVIRSAVNGLGTELVAECQTGEDSLGVPRWDHVSDEHENVRPLYADLAYAGAMDMVSRLVALPKENRGLPPPQDYIEPAVEPRVRRNKD